MTGVDGIEIDGVRDRVDEFVLGDLEDGIPADVGTGFDVVVAADVIEHVRDPRALLSQMNDRVARGGQVLVSTPNFGHWYPRARVASGMFDYDRRGILDQTHLRFFSRRSLLRTIQSAGLEVQELRYTGLPFDVLSRDASLRTRAVRRVDELLVKLRPTLFAYQFVLRTTPRAGGSVTRG